jgi:hypothetical protein
MREKNPSSKLSEKLGSKKKKRQEYECIILLCNLLSYPKESRLVEGVGVQHGGVKSAGWRGRVCRVQ